MAFSPCLASAIAFSIVASVSPAPAAAESNNWPTIDWFLNLRDLGQVQVSPDGRLLALEVQRPRARLARREERGYFRTDIWLVDLARGEARQVTFGERDGSAYWSPLWSPGGRRIALLTNSGDGAVKAAVLDVASGDTHLMSDQPVDFEVNFGSVSAFGPGALRRWGVWAGEATFYTVLSRAQTINPSLVAASPDVLYDPLWAATRTGSTSVSVWSSREPVVCGHDNALVALPVDGGPARTLYTGPVRSVTLSPDQRSAALVLAVRPRSFMSDEPSTREPDYNPYHQDSRVETGLAVLDLEMRDAPLRSLAVADARFLSSADGPRWSANSDVLSVPVFSRDQAPSVAVVRLGGEAIDRYPASSRTHVQLLALAFSRHSDERQRLAMTIERAFRRLGATPQTDVTSANQLVRGFFPTLFSLGAADVGVQAGERFGLFDLSSGSLIDIVELPGADLVVSTPAHDVGAPVAILRRADEYLILAADRGRLVLRPLATPHVDAVPLLITPQGGLVVWTSNDKDGLAVWRTEADGSQPRRLMSLNAPPPPYDTGYLDYSLPDGRKVSAALLYPPGYELGRPYPMIVVGYPGLTFARSSRARHFRAEDFFHAAMFAFAARGFIVARPSTPLVYDREYEPLTQMAMLIEAAAQAAIEQGVARAGSVGFFGHSHGGFTALAVAARTRVVSAVVASAPIYPDLEEAASRPGVAHAVAACAPNLLARGLAEIEDPNGIFLRMSVPAHVDPQRYRRNSPLHQLSPQSPPTLIFQGQFDAKGTGMAEATYIRLARMGVETEIARYWGEGHNLAGPGNVRDALERAANWFGRHLTAER